MNARRPPSPWLKLAIDIGPLAAFFAAYSLAGLMAATAVLMVATLSGLAVAYAIERRIPKMPLIGAALVLGFGALTLALDDETFIKMKPTAVYLLFAAVLLAGQATGRSLLKPLLDAAFHIDDAGWRIMTLRWGVFFLVMAGVNEILWRNFPTEIWVNAKVFGFLPLTFAFAAAQAPLMRRHALPEDTKPS
ncbi:MAG: septation protein A [Alphaproteobacteria bacterium]